MLYRMLIFTKRNRFALSVLGRGFDSPVGSNQTIKLLLAKHAALMSTSKD